LIFIKKIDNLYINWLIFVSIVMRGKRVADNYFNGAKMCDLKSQWIVNNEEWIVNNIIESVQEAHFVLLIIHYSFLTIN